MWKLKVLPTAVFAYYCFPNRIGKKNNWRKQKTKSEELSRNSARKMKRAIQWLIACSDVKKSWEKKHSNFVEWKVNHICLTFWENLTDDNRARKILSQWLEMAKYRFQLKQYVWKAEPQERGAIHFHLTTNVYIPHKELRYTWNRALRKNGMKNVNENSIDVHAVSNENEMCLYFADYLTDKEKHEGRRKIKGRLWGCSHDLASAGADDISIDDHEMEALEGELRKFSLAARISAEGREVPEFLKHVNFWMAKPEQIGGEIFNLYQKELNKIKLKPEKKQLEFWERMPSKDAV